MKKIIVGAFVTGLSILGFAGVAEAHTAEAKPSCSGLTVKAFIYPADVSVVITIDGVVKHSGLGGGQWDYDWSQTVNHTWSAVIDSPDGAGGTEFDHNFGGTWKACYEDTTTTQPVETTTTQPAETTTTTEETTTTVVTEEPTTTTTVPVETTTTTVVTEEPTTTTTVVGVLIPPVNGTAPPAADMPVDTWTQADALPRTGAVTQGLVLIAASTLLSGLLVFGTSKRFKAKR